MENSFVGLADNKLTEVSTEGVDTSKRFRFDLNIGQGQQSLYEKKFPKTRINKLSRIQIGLAILIVSLQIVVMSLIKWNTPSEASGVGIWSSIIVFCAAKCAQSVSEKNTFKRLRWTMGLHFVATICTLTLVILVLSESISSQKYRLLESGNYDRYDYDDRGPLVPAWICFVLTIASAFAGLLQLGMSITVFSMATAAICTGTFKFEYKVMEMRDQENGDDDRNSRKHADKCGGTSPPSYHQISLEVAKPISA